MIKRLTVAQRIGSTRIGWMISFIVWCIYWRICRQFNNGIHFDRTYFIFGWIRSQLLNLGADTHPVWSQRRHYIRYKWNQKKSWVFA